MKWSNLTIAASNLEIQIMLGNVQEVQTVQLFIIGKHKEEIYLYNFYIIYYYHILCSIMAVERHFENAYYNSCYSSSIMIQFELIHFWWLLQIFVPSTKCILRSFSKQIIKSPARHDKVNIIDEKNYDFDENDGNKDAFFFDF